MNQISTPKARERTTKLTDWKHKEGLNKAKTITG